MSEVNPYESPASDQAPETPAAARYGGFITTILIMDLVFCCLRLVFGLGGYAMYRFGAVATPIAKTAPYEVVTALALGAIGTAAASLLLAKRRLGLVFGWLTTLAAVANISVGIWQALLLSRGIENQVQRIGWLIGGGFTLLARVVILALYIVALILCARRLAKVQDGEIAR